MPRVPFLTLVLLLGARPAMSQTLSGERLAPPAEEFLLDLVRDAGLSGVRVTSFERTARRQAELMYDLLESVGVGPVHDQYDSIGDAVVDFYEANRGALGRAALIRGMEEVVSEGVRAAPDRQQMMHVLPTTNYTFDVAPSSVAPNEDAFSRAILDHAEGDLANYILPGPAEAAFHLEVPRTLPTISGRYSGACDGRTVTITLVREPDGYAGTIAARDGSSSLDLVEVDRLGKSIVIEHAELPLPEGTLSPGYTALDFGDDGSCLLERLE